MVFKFDDDPGRGQLIDIGGQRRRAGVVVDRQANEIDAGKSL
jgi:hypothetical protein